MSDDIRLLSLLITEDPDISNDDQVLNEINNIVNSSNDWYELVDVSNASQEYDTHSDPGDYPSGAGSSPKRDQQFVSGVSAAVVFRISTELQQLFDAAESGGYGEFPYSEIFENNLEIEANEMVADQLPRKNYRWHISRDGALVTFSAA